MDSRGVNGTSTIYIGDYTEWMVSTSTLATILAVQVLLLISTEAQDQRSSINLGGRNDRLVRAPYPLRSASPGSGKRRNLAQAVEKDYTIAGHAGMTHELPQ